MPTPRKLSLAPLLLLFAAPAAAEPPETPTFEGLVEVSEVLIDVLATDGEGRPVPGLGIDDFVLEEDGRPVKLASVAYYTTRYDDTGAETGDVPSSRYLVLFFHDALMSGDFNARALRQQLKAGREAQDWVGTELRGSDWLAVVSFDYKLKVHQDFTQDRESIVFAIEQAISRQDPEKTQPRRRPPPSGTPSILRHLPEGKTLRRETRNLCDALRLLAESTGYLVGRKNLLLFTFGFDTSASVRLSRAYDAMEAAVNDHNVAVYPIHLGGSGVGQPYSVVLRGLATDTGGVYYENFRRFAAPLADIGDENYGYYVLSYQSQHPAGEIGYARVEVRARGEGIRIRARRGYRYGL